jgi:Domain of unknown function (DUF4111)
VLPDPAARVVNRFLARLDRAAPRAVGGFYVVGSIALAGFRAGRSDIDFVATLDRPLSPAELNALRSVHRRSWAEGVIRGFASPPHSWPLACNGMFLRAADLALPPLALPPLAVTPVAAQVAGRFAIGPRRGFDRNPVTWWTLAHKGIAVRGPSPEQLDIHLDDAGLRKWTAANLVSYWRPWAAAIAGSGTRAWPVRLTHLHARRLTAWGVLGTARMHATICSGTVISKEQAGEYALDVFDAGWHPVLHDALAYWRGLPPRPGRTSRVLRTETAAFVTHVIDAAGSAGSARHPGTVQS